MLVAIVAARLAPSYRFRWAMAYGAVLWHRAVYAMLRGLRWLVE